MTRSASVQRRHIDHQRRRRRGGTVHWPDVGCVVVRASHFYSVCLARFRRNENTLDGEQHDTWPLQVKTVGEPIDVYSVPQHGRPSQRLIGSRLVYERGGDTVNSPFGQ